MSAYGQALLDAAYAAYRIGDYEHARGTLGLVVGSGWRELLTLRFIARVEERLGNLNASAGWLQAATEIDPGNAAVHSDFGDVTPQGRSAGRSDPSLPACDRMRSRSDQRLWRNGPCPAPRDP